MNAGVALEALWEARTRAAQADEAARLARMEVGIAQARYHYAAAEPVRSHKILSDRGLDGAGLQDLRADPEGLIVPLYRKGDLVGMAGIAHDGRTAFLPDPPPPGARYTIGRAQEIRAIVRRDFLSALVCFRALKNAQVFLCFDEPTAQGLANEARGLVIDTTESWSSFLEQKLREWAPRASIERLTKQQIRQEIDSEIRDALMRDAVYHAPPVEGIAPWAGNGRGKRVAT